MRPVQLDLDGFGSFRTRSSVDFRDADYFALVGPTGAGKSTVVDAIVFALYGSVPRWDNRRAVEWALAPTAGRGVVRLVFDVGPDRYVAVRELRRSAQGKVGVRNARLERVPDPADLDRTEVLAADSEVNAAVERLLGLSFEHFVRCVILPQGDFARFLHSTAKERQDTLVDLLGIRVYREVAKAANAEAVAARTRAEVAAGRLAGYADATESAAAAAAERIAAMDTLAADVARQVPELTRAAAAVASARTECDRLAGERQLLAALRVPAGLDALDRSRRQAAAALVAADGDLAAAEKADTLAREAVAAAPARAPLERAREAWAELDRLAAELPALAAEQARRQAALRAVEEAGRAARAEVGVARAARDAAVRADQAAHLRGHLAVGEPCPVCTQVVGALPGSGDRSGDGSGGRSGDRSGGRSGGPRRAADPGAGALPLPGLVDEPEDPLAAADARIAAADAAVDRLQREWQAASRDLQAVAGRVEAATARATAVRGAVAGQPDTAGTAAALAELDRLDLEARSADRALREARRHRDAAARADQEAQARLAGARTELDRARDPLVRLGAPPPSRTDLSADWLALAEWALAAAEERGAGLAAAEEAAATARDRLDARTGELAGALAAAGVTVPAGRPLAEAAEPAVAAAAGQARAAAARVAERREEAAALRETVREAEESAGVAKLLGQLLRADGFERWLLTSALDVLVTDAGATLLELSGGQFELTHDGRDFAVIDHADADSVRPVRTLSGGETFQASLALALALSAQLAGLAAGASARLDAIILDEGFGTLDEATLDVVAGTLESLAAAGERMVGVVTHVGALADRVPVRFAVRRGPDGSAVTREDV